MFEFRSAIEKGADRAAGNGKPFVGPELPLVGPKLPVIKPSIGLLIPFDVIRRFHGFTAIELLITIAIAAILVSLALPDLRVFIQNNRLKTEASELYAALNFARNEAKAHAITVTVCASNTQTSCPAGAAWKDGWIVWADRDRGGDVDASEILRARAAPDNGIVVTGSAVNIQYFADGSTSGDFTFDVCDDTRTGEKGRTITVKSIGQAHSGEKNDCA